MWTRQMTLEQIDLQGNGFHEALNAFIIFHTMESVSVANTEGNHTVWSKCCFRAHTPLLFVVHLVDVTSTVSFTTLSDAFLHRWHRLNTEVSNGRVGCGGFFTETTPSSILCIHHISNEEWARARAARSLRCPSQMNIHPLLPVGPRH